MTNKQRKLFYIKSLNNDSIVHSLTIKKRILKKIIIILLCCFQCLYSIQHSVNSLLRTFSVCFIFFVCLLVLKLLNHVSIRASNFQETRTFFRPLCLLACNKLQKYHLNDMKH